MSVSIDFDELPYDLYEILNDEEDTVGWYKEDDGIISFDDGYDEIHEDHDDYNP